MGRLMSTMIVVSSVGVLAGCAAPPDAANAGPHSPGWTGRTVVVGNNSTVADNKDATYWTQVWPIGPRR